MVVGFSSMVQCFSPSWLWLAFFWLQFVWFVCNSIFILPFYSSDSVISCHFYDSMRCVLVLPFFPPAADFWWHVLGHVTAAVGKWHFEGSIRTAPAEDEPIKFNPLIGSSRI